MPTTPEVISVCSGDANGLGLLSLKRKQLQFLKVPSGYRARPQAAASADCNGVGIPTNWYNLVADLPVKPPPPLNPRTFEPVKPEDLAPLFPDELIKQEVSDERFVEIPEEVLDVYRLWRPTPLIRFVFSYNSCTRSFEFK